MTSLPMTPRNLTAPNASTKPSHSDLYAFLIALPLSLAGTAFLTFLLDAGSRIAM
jgi:hypothetical protein